MKSRLPSGKGYTTTGYVPFTWQMERTLTRPSSLAAAMLPKVENSEALPPLALWHYARRVTNRMPPDFALGILNQLYNQRRFNVGPIVRQLCVEDYTPLERVNLTRLLLARGFAVEATHQINLLMQKPQEIPFPDLQQLWQEIAKSDVWCPAAMTEWVKNMPRGKNMPHPNASGKKKRPRPFFALNFPLLRQYPSY